MTSPTPLTGMFAPAVVHGRYKGILKPKVIRIRVRVRVRSLSLSRYTLYLQSTCAISHSTCPKCQISYVCAVVYCMSITGR